MRNAQIVSKINFWGSDLRVSTCCGSFGKKKLSLHHGHVLRNGSLWQFTISMGKLFISWCIISVGIPVTEKWPQKSEIGIKDGFQKMEHKFSCGTFWDRQHLVASKVFLLLKQPKKLCSIWGNSQSCWILLVSEANKFPLRKLGYSTPIFIVFTIFDVSVLVQQNLNWVSH